MYIQISFLFFSNLLFCFLSSANMHKLGDDDRSTDGRTDEVFQIDDFESLPYSNRVQVTSRSRVPSSSHRISTTLDSPRFGVARASLFSLSNLIRQQQTAILCVHACVCVCVAVVECCVALLYYKKISILERTLLLHIAIIIIIHDDSFILQPHALTHTQMRVYSNNEKKKKKRTNEQRKIKQI